MNKFLSTRIIRLGAAVLLLAGVLITHVEDAAATPIHFQQTSDQITVNPVTGLTTTEVGGIATYTIVLNAQPSADVTIGLSSNDLSEGTIAPASLTFTNADWNIPQTVTVTGVDDLIADGGVAYQIVSAPAVSGDPVFTGQNASDVSVTNTDNDTAGITVTPTSGLTTSEAATSASFTVVLTSQPTDDVTLGLTSSDLSEGTVAPGSLTFNGANWNTAQTVTVTGVDDQVDDGPIAYTIITATPTGSDSVYNTINPADVAVLNTNNDTAGITVTPTSGLVTTEGNGTAGFTVVLTSQPTADVTIGLSSSNTTEGTVAPPSLTFTTGNWNVPQNVTVTGANDAVVDGSIGYTIITAPATSADGTYNTRNAADVSVTNLDNDNAGITVTPTSGLVTSEAGGSASFSIVLTSQPTASVTIGLSSSDTTEGTPSPTSLTFTTGNWSVAQNVSVNGVNDFAIDGNIPYQIVTAQASSGDSAYNVINPADVSVTNTDNDAAGIIVSTISGPTSEGGASATFTVVLNSQPGADVTIGLTSSNTTEGTVAPGSLTFTNANWNTPRTVTVTGVDDAAVDGPIGYSIITSAATSTDTNYTGLNPADVSVTNTDNDAAGITVSATSLNTTELGGFATFTIVLTSQPSGDVTIGLSSSDTTEGTVTPASLVFTNANWGIARTVTVTGVDDQIADGPIGYSVVTAPAVSGDGNYSGRDAANVSVTNADNDVAGFTFNPSSGLTTTEPGGTATFTVSLTTQPSANVTINLSSSDATEGSVSPASLTFTNVNWASTQTVTVTGLDDSIVDGAVGYSIITSTATSGDGSYNGLNPADVSVTNTDNDNAGITVSPTTGLITTEAGGTASFTVVLTSQPSGNVTISLSSSNTNEGTVAPASLVFTSGNWNAAQTVTVTGANDFIVDGTVGYNIITAPAVSTDGFYSGVNPPDVAVTNTDNDNAAITVTAAAGLTTTEAGGTATFTVVLTSQPTATVTIGVVSNDLTEGTAAPASLVFTTGNWNTAQTVTVTGVNDSIVDGNVAYTIVTAQATSTDTIYSAINPADVAVTNTDNDVAGFTLSATTGLVTTEAGGSATFTIQLNSQPSVDVIIGLSSSDFSEGTVLPASLTFTSVTWNTPQTVTVTGANDFIIDGPIVYTIITAPASTTDAAYSGLNAADVSVTNTDNDVAGITVAPTTGLITTELGGLTTFTVVLTSQPSADVTIALSSSDTTEGTVAPASLVFTAANWNSLQTVTITGVDDLVADINIAYQIVTAPAVSTDPNYSNRNAADVSVTNTNNDVAGITLSATSGLTTSEAVGGTATFTVVLTSQPLANVTIGLSSSDLTEGTVAPVSLVFTTANWNVLQTVTITGVDDLMADGAITYTITTAAATSTDSSYNTMNAANVTVTNQDNDTAGTTVNPTSGLITNEANGTATFTVVLNTQPLYPVTIGLSSSVPSEATVLPASLTFTTANWNVVQTVTVTGVPDGGVYDVDKPFTINTSAASSTDTVYNNQAVPDVTGINQNRDFRPVAVNDSYQTNAKPTQPFNKAAPGVLSNDTDANNDPLTASLSAGTTKGTLTLSPDGSFVYTPNAIFPAVETDSFTYFARDGKNLSATSATVNIVIDTFVPTVSWVTPVPNGGVYEVSDQFMLLEAAATDYSISQVRFFRWDAVKLIYVDIGVVTTSPYEFNLDTSTLNFFWNQIFVSVRDSAGNNSSTQFIWIYRDLPFQLFMPRVAR